MTKLKKQHSGAPAKGPYHVKVETPGTLGQSDITVASEESKTTGGFMTPIKAVSNLQVAHGGNLDEMLAPSIPHKSRKERGSAQQDAQDSLQLYCQRDST